MPDNSLTITDLRITPVAIADPPIRSSYGLHQPYALRTIVELVSGDGIIGVSETYGEEPMKALEDLRDQIIGADPYRLTGTLASLVQGREYGGDASQTYLVPGENPLDATSRTYAAVEVGCLDLIGKSVGVPVCDLIGGRVRDKVPFSAYPFYKHAGGGGEGEDAPTGQVRRVPHARDPRRASVEDARGVRIRIDQVQGGRFASRGGD